MGLLNLAVVDTTPGNDLSCPFCPPIGWQGGSSEFSELMRGRFIDDLEAGQRMYVYARHYWLSDEFKDGQTKVIGPFKEQVLDILLSLN